MKKGYVGYNLTPDAREKILSIFSPKYIKVIAHHITLSFGVDESYLIPNHVKATVIGYAHNENIECLVVKVGDTVYRPDGKLFHITLSHNEKAKPVDSNHLLETKGYELIDTFEIDVVPKFNPFN